MAFKHKDAQLCKQNHLTISFYDICQINLFMSFCGFDMLMLISLTFQVSLDKKGNLMFLFFILWKLILFAVTARLLAWVVWYVLKIIIFGLFWFGSSYERIVPNKLGRSLKTDLVAFEKEYNLWWEPCCLPEGISYYKESVVRLLDYYVLYFLLSNDYVFFVIEWLCTIR